MKTDRLQGIIFTPVPPPKKAGVLVERLKKLLPIRRRAAVARKRPQPAAGQGELAAADLAKRLRIHSR